MWGGGNEELFNGLELLFCKMKKFGKVVIQQWEDR